jgi:ubiquinone/menaquinone biosynthesis C-methylase UbiE
MQEQQHYADLNVRLEHESKDSFTEERYVQLAKFITQPAATILDVGCSKGEGGPVLKSVLPGCHVTGLDCVVEHLAALPTAYSQKIEGLTTDIPVKDQSFDAIIGAEFIEHLYPKDVDSTLCEFQRILKVGGMLLMTTPNPSYIRNRINGKSVYGRSHLTQHHPAILKHRLLAHGFYSVKIHGSGKVSRYLTTRFPFLSVYGSYAVIAIKR